MTVLCLIKLLICSQLVYLIVCLLITLYMSFYHLIYLEGLMCFVQMFQVTGIHVPSSSQFLDLGVSEFSHCSRLTFKSRVCFRVFCHGIAKWGDCKFVIYNYVLCWLLFYEKKCCNCFNFVPCILWDFIVFYCIGFSIKLVKTQA